MTPRQKSRDNTDSAGFANVEAAFARHQALAHQMLDSHNDTQMDRYAARMDMISSWWEPRYPSEWQNLRDGAED